MKEFTELESMSESRYYKFEIQQIMLFYEERFV